MKHILVCCLLKSIVQVPCTLAREGLHARLHSKRSLEDVTEATSPQESGGEIPKSFLDESQGDQQSNAALEAKIKDIEDLVAIEQQTLAAQQRAFVALQKHSRTLQTAEQSGTELESDGVMSPISNGDGQLAPLGGVVKSGGAFLPTHDQREIEFHWDTASGKENTDSKEDVPEKNKVHLALISSFCLGLFGVDRCFMDNIVLGIIKGLTGGGCGIWFFIDYWIIVYYCLLKKDSMDTLGFKATFADDQIEPAFWIIVGFLILKCCLQCGGAICRHLTKHDDHDPVDGDPTQTMINGQPAKQPDGNFTPAGTS